jgi:diguanylate cyclase (GGDEF)-like protein
MSELPALPDGASLDAPAGLPPLPPGASLDAHPSDRVASKEQGLGETAARALTSSAVRAVGTVPYLAGGIAGLVGARDTADTLFGAYEKTRAAADKIQGAAQTSIGGRIAQTLGGLPVGIATLGAEAIPESGASVIRDGGSVKEALGQTALNTAATAAAAGIGGLGKTIAQRVTQQGIASGALGQVARVAGNAMRGPDQQEDFDPVQLGIDVGTGVGFGFIPHARAPETPKPEVLGITHQPDFVTDARGRTVANKGDQTLGQPVVGGAGLDQQAPGGPPSPVIPPDAAPLALTHQPDVTVDSRGRAVMNKGDRTLGQPVGPAFEEQAPPPKPAGPLTAALEAGGVKPPPEAAAPAVEATPQPTTDNSGAAAATPPTPAPVEAYQQRQQQIEALNDKRKSSGISDAENDQLHDLRDQQDRVNPVSGLPNRRALDEALATGRYTHSLAIDLDGFKKVNDQFGHKVGDLVLQEVGRRFNDESDGNLLFTHNSGDEYAGAAKGDPTERVRAIQSELDKTPITVSYVDADGKTVEHTLQGLGFSFGVGKDLHAADLNIQADKTDRTERGLRVAGREKNSRSGDNVEGLRAAEGSEAPVGEDGRQADLRGTEGTGDAVSEPAASTSDRGAAAAGESRGAGAVQRAEDTGAAPVRGGDGNERDAARRALAEAGAEGQRSGVGNSREQRVAQSEQDHFNNLASEVGWDQVGGKLLRESDRSDGLKSEVTGRTQWVGKQGFLGESQLWRDRPDKRLKESQALEAFRKQAAGEQLKPIEQRFIDHARKTAKIYAHEEETARQSEADRRGFDSVESMHEHDANNFVGGEYNGEPREDIPFSRGGKQGMSRGDLQSAISDTLSGWKGDAPRVQVHQSHEDAPPSLRNSVGFDRSVEGAYDPRSNTVHLFGDAISTPKRAMQVLAHEVIGHYGVEAVVGKQWPKLVRDLNAMRERAPAAMKSVLDEVARRYPGADADTFASEAMAVMAEKGIRNSFMDRAIAAVRQFLRAHGFDVKFNDADLRQMLVGAARRVEGEKFSGVPNGQLAFSKRAGGADADLFGGGEKPRDEGASAPRPATGDLFGGASSRDHVDAAVRAKDDALSGNGTAVTMRQGDGELFAGPRPKQALFSKADKEKPSIGYAGDRFKQRDRLAERKFDKPYAQLSADDKADVDALFQTTSAAKNPMFSKASAETESKPAESFLDKATGVLRPNKAEQAARALKAIALQGRELARGVSRAAWAQRDRAVGQADAAIDAFRSHFDARPADVRGDALRSYEPIIAYQQGKTIADPVAKKFADTFADLFARQAAEIRKFGEDKLGLLDQYFPQLWEDPGRAEKMYADMAAKRPLAGNKSFTKERVFADYEQGIKAGMKPAFDNPADALMARYQSGERYLSALRIKDGVDKLGLLQDIGQGDRVPVGFARVNDNSFAGKVVPEMVARDLNNYLAPGLSQFKAWRSFRYAQNLLLSMRLGFSAFHAGFTTVDSAMTHLDLGMRQALSGDVAGALKHLAQIPLTPIHAVQGLFGKGDGAKLVRQFYGKEAIEDPHTAAVLDALTQGGARGRMDPTDYNNDFAQMMRAWKTDGAKALAKTPLRTFGAVLEGAMRPIAHNLVPAQKMTARVELMKHELDRVAEQLGQKKGDYASITKAMSEPALRQIANSVVTRVDDRLGQLAYDNLFWNRTVKDIMQASIQSVGWNVGTKNVIFGGLGDVRKIFNPEKLLAPLDKEGKITDATMSRVTGRLSYLVALNLGVGALGGITQYLLTGEGPSELKDYFFPKTGNKNPDGTDARISFPSYVKDEFGFARHPIDTVQHKLHPSFSMVAELLNNKDFYGNQVYNPDDPWSKVATQLAGHVVGGFVPYAAQNRSQVSAAGGGIGAQIAPFVGITPAPGSETHSDAQNYISQSYYAAHPSESKTPDKAAHSKEFSQAVNAIRSGQTPDLADFTPAERGKIQKYAREDPATLVQKHFAALPLQQQLAAYDKASAAERAQYKMRATIIQKSGRQLANETDVDERERMRERVNRIRSTQ